MVENANTDRENTTMSTPNESRPAERLAAALRPVDDVAEVAAALQGCMDSAAHAAAQKVKEELVPRLDKQDKTIRQMREHMNTRLDRQDDTLRAMWKQMKGNGKLPMTTECREAPPP